MLLVDDEVEFVSTLAERLILRGFDVQTEFGGEGALRRMESDTPQVVVLDRMMPGMGGMEVLEFIKTHYPGVPVILLTGQGPTDKGMEGIRSGAFDFLMKPVSIQELIEKIGRAVKADS